MIGNIATMALAAAMLFGAYLVAFVGERRGYPLPDGASRLGYLDGVRGYLALAVAAHHMVFWLMYQTTGSWPKTGLSRFQVGLGRDAVAIFFMITAFLFYPRVLKGFKGNVWPSVFVSRVFRIYPLVLLVVPSIFVLLWLDPGSRRSIHGADVVGMVQWLTFWREPDLFGVADSFTTNSGVLWSLWYEWMFYLFLLPFCAATFAFAGGHRWVGPAAMFALCAAGTYMPGFHYPMLYGATFALGMLGYEAQSIEKVRVVLTTGPAAVVAGALLLLSLFLFSSAGIVGVTLCAPFFFCVAAGNSFWGAFSARPSLVLGEASYGIYLAHGVILYLAFRWSTVPISALPLWLIGLIALLLGAIITALAALTFLAIEKPMIARGHVVARRLRRHREATSAT